MANRREVKEISSDWIRCLDCGWIGKTEDSTIEGFNGLLSCQSCTCLEVEEYHGPTSVEVPVDLLHLVLYNLRTGVIMIGSPHFPGESKYVQASRDCVLMAYRELIEHMAKAGVTPPDVHDDDDEEEDSTDKDEPVEGQLNLLQSQEKS